MSSVAGTASGPVPLERQRARRRAVWRRRGTVLLFMSPWIAGFLIFFGYPLVWSAYLSLTHYDLLSPPRWVGLANYRFLFGTDQTFWIAVKNTLWFLAIAVPLQVLFAFFIALLLQRARRGVGTFRTVFYLPALAPAVAATLAFVYLLNPATGPVNIFLSKLGIEGPLWFDSPSWAKPSLTLLAIWGVGNMMIIFLAAIVDVPQHLYEAAEIDGAGPLRRLVYVTLPSISPVLLFALVIGVIDGLQYFTQAYVAATIAGGSAASTGTVATNLGYPENSTLFYPVLLYQQAFQNFNMGYASAIAMLLLAVSFAIVLAIVLNSKRFVHFQAGGR